MNLFDDSPETRAKVTPPPPAGVAASTIGALVPLYLRGDPSRFWRGKYAQYPLDPSGHSEAVNIDYAIRHMTNLVIDLEPGDPRATRSGPVAASRHLADLSPDQVKPADVRAIQQELLVRKHKRDNLNRTIKRILGFFEWCVSFELCSPETLRALECVEAIRAGDPDAVEGTMSEAVSRETLEKFLACAPWLLKRGAIVQYLCDLRPCELAMMKACEIHRDPRTPGAWEYRPQKHKTKHKGKPRVVPIGPVAQELIRQVVSYMYDDTACLFGDDELAARVPRVGDASDQRRLFYNAARLNDVGWKTSSAYRKALARAAADAGVELKPNQLRKTRTTEVCEQYGVEVGAEMAGHADTRTTERHYWTKSGDKARHIAQTDEPLFEM